MRGAEAVLVRICLTIPLESPAQAVDVDGELHVRNANVVAGVSGHAREHSLALHGASFAEGSVAENCADGSSSGVPPLRAVHAGVADSPGTFLLRACGGGHSSVRAGFSGAEVAAAFSGVQRLRPSVWQVFRTRWCLWFFVVK